MYAVPRGTHLPHLSNFIPPILYRVIGLLGLSVLRMRTRHESSPTVQRQDQTYIEVIDFEQCAQPEGNDLSDPDSGRRIVVDSRGRPLPDDLYESLREGGDAAEEAADVNAIDLLA